jgi:hypothetical protein
MSKGEPHPYQSIQHVTALLLVLLVTLSPATMACPPSVTC